MSKHRKRIAVDPKDCATCGCLILAGDVYYLLHGVRFCDWCRRKESRPA